MKYTIYVKHRYPKGLFRSSYSANTKIGVWIKALWDTKGSWQYFDYQFE